MTMYNTPIYNFCQNLLKTKNDYVAHSRIHAMSVAMKHHVSESQQTE